MGSPLALGTLRGWGHSWGHLPGCWHGQGKINGFVVRGQLSELQLLPGTSLSGRREPVGSRLGFSLPPPWLMV